MVLLSIVAAWLVVALVLGVTVGRSIRRADAVELAAHASWDVRCSADGAPAGTTGWPTVADALPRPTVAPQAA